MEKDAVYQPDLFDRDNSAVVEDQKHISEEPAPMMCCGEWVQPWAHCRHCGTRND